MTIQDGVNRATGWDLDCVRQLPQQALANLACAPVRLFALGCDNCRFYLFGQLVGITERPARPIAEPFQTAFFVPLKDLVAGLP